MKELTQSELKELLDSKEDFSETKICIEPEEYIYKFKHLGHSQKDLVLAQSIFKGVRSTFENLKTLTVPEELSWDHNSSDGVECFIGFDEVTKDTISINLDEHMCINGLTRTGKSTLLNNITDSIEMSYSPLEVKMIGLYIERGGYFKYSNKEIMYDSMLYILRKTANEVKARAELFEYLGVSDLKEFRDKYNLVLPRIVLVIDEVACLVSSVKDSTEIRDLLEYCVTQGKMAGLSMIGAVQSDESPRTSFLKDTKHKLVLNMNVDKKEGYANIVKSANRNRVLIPVIKYFKHCNYRKEFLIKIE